MYRQRQTIIDRPDIGQIVADPSRLVVGLCSDATQTLEVCGLGGLCGDVTARSPYFFAKFLIGRASFPMSL
jgi:hypothetical protein